MRRFLENSFWSQEVFLEYVFSAHFMGFLSESCPRNILKMSFHYLTLLPPPPPETPNTVVCSIQTVLKVWVMM